MKKFFAVLAVVVLVAFAAPAFAANPFMDVPAGHWAYDAVAQLAARGVVSGYPDGAFKGAQPATRYEVASVVARALAQIDMEKASKQDLEMLKKLVMEFKDELDALGVKVDGIDKRVAVLEDRLGGWKLRGVFNFDANFAGGQDANSSYTESAFQTAFQKERLRLTLSKQIDENTLFYAQFRGGSNASGGGTGVGDIGALRIRDSYVDMKLAYDVDFRVGRFLVDFEDAHGLYSDNDAIFGDYRVDGFRFMKSWGNMVATAVVGRNTQMDAPVSTDYTSQYMNYAVDLFWQPNEKFFGGVGGNWFIDDESATGVDASFTTYDVYAGFNFTPSVTLQGIYYWQNIGNSLRNDMVAGTTNDSPKAWKAALVVKQDLFKFSGLRLEYQVQDNSFVGVRNPYSFGARAGNAASIAANMPWNNNSTKFLFVYADQKWNDKWSSYIRYQTADFDTTGLDDAKGYGAAITYQYTPAVAFSLAYDHVDYGTNVATTPLGGTKTVSNGTDHVVQFRTAVSF